jgi:hypothetical protein
LHRTFHSETIVERDAKLFDFEQSFQTWEERLKIADTPMFLSLLA